MSESNSHSKYDEKDDDSQHDLQIIEQLLKCQKKTSQNQKNYMRISSRQQKIDTEAILQQFKKEFANQREKPLSIPKNHKSKKIEKVPVTPSKKYDFGYIKQKWKAVIDKNIQEFKQYLFENKKAYDAKQKEFLLDFFKILLDGYFQLKDYSESFPQELTKNQKKIIHQDTSQLLWLQKIVQSFDKAFKEAKMNYKIANIKDKWDSLILNLRDQNNFELRRKIIRAKIKPNEVIENSNEFLMSEEAKLKILRESKLILAESNIKLDKIHEDEESIQNQMEEQKIEELPEPQNLRSISQNENLQRKISLEKEKMQEYRLFIDQLQSRIKQRIYDDLKGTTSYPQIMNDYLSKFTI